MFLVPAAAATTAAAAARQHLYMPYLCHKYTNQIHIRHSH